METSLSARDRGLLVELERSLADLRRPAYDHEPMRMLDELFGAELVTCFGFDRDGESLLLDDIATSGPLVPVGYFHELEAGVRAGETSFLFSARMPEREQRNRPIFVDGARATLTLRRDEAARLGLTRASHRALLPGRSKPIALHARYHIADHWQLRTLVCDGPLVLKYVNVLQAKPFTTRQTRVYKRALRL